VLKYVLEQICTEKSKALGEQCRRELSHASQRDASFGSAGSSSCRAIPPR
jgi:hypothetical protein